MNRTELDTRGLVTALVTPFDAADHVDSGALQDHLQWLWQQGCRHVLISGTTGEFFSLTADERIALLQTARSAYPGTLMFHAGADGLRETLHLVRAACDAGADSVACLPPWYLTGAEEEGIIRYFEAVSFAATVPFLIYNFPKHTRSDVTPEMLSRVPHWGIKDSSGNLALIPRTPRYFIGSDRAMLMSHRAGGAGFISARSNCEPGLYARIDEALRRGEDALAESLHGEILRITESLDGPGQISLVKRRVAAMLPGYPTAVRLPLLDHPADRDGKTRLS